MAGVGEVRLGEETYLGFVLIWLGQIKVGYGETTLSWARMPSEKMWSMFC